ncbi:MAG: hypothetical protein AVDCRST_MAG91-3776 [uncultured Sphingomonadaceae bacterium]|uniref:Uncharacterized protein n=1 Tax=uncultured Sphingomonadaceae bacterium TaxID=169976 RepID=A0A6J4U4C0_9SPHN|nr:MAG: hypothetical protein AVDCRST_MAG91-3776 [uncultured Sphingomonadaceae bacterium]
MSILGDAMRTIESVVLLRSKVERLDEELAATNNEVRNMFGVLLQMDRRIVRLETLEEMRTGVRPFPKIEG